MSFYDRETSLRSRANIVMGALKVARPLNVAYRAIGAAEFALAPALLAINTFVTPILSEGASHVGAQLLLGTAVAWAISEINLEVRKYQADVLSAEGEDRYRRNINRGTKGR